MLALAIGACEVGTTDPPPASTGSSGPPDSGAPAESSDASAELSELILAAAPFSAHLDRQLISHSSPDQLYNIVDPVIRMSEEGELLPGLAETWTAIDDTTLRLEFRDDVVFSDGAPFDAEAFKVSMDRTLAEESRVGAGFFPTLEEVQVVEEFTVDLIHAPDVGLPAALAINAHIYSPQAISEDPEGLKTNPIGSGPYRVESYEPGQSMRLVARDDYWGREEYGAPTIRTVILSSVEESGVRMARYQAGEAHLAVDLSPDEVAQVDAANVLALPSTDLYFLRLKFDDPLTGDIRVRQAINLAIDRVALTEIYAGYGEAASQFWGSNVTGWAPREIPEVDLEEARSLIEEAGVQDQVLDLVYSSAFKPGNSELGQAIGAMIEQIGVRVSLNDIDLTTFRAYIREPGPSAPLLLLSMSHESLEAIDNVPSRFACDGPLSVYCNEAVDNLTAEARSVQDRDERVAKLQEIADVLEQDVAAIPLVHPALLWVKTDGLEFTPLPVPFMPFAEMTLTE